MRKKWQVAPAAPRTHIDRFPTLSRLLIQTLYNRGLTDPQEVTDFLAGHWPEADVFSMRDMPRAVDILIRAIKRREKVAIYGDFDADGVTSTALLVHTLTGLGADVQPYIPNRVDEGYGLNLDALRQLYGQGVRLVVTADCGIRAVAEIEQARRGLEFIVTDHHSVGPELPFASAIINPKRNDCPYPFKDLAGVGVAFKLSQALIREASRCGIPVHVEERPLQDLVAIGTVADLAPLLGENRALVRQGLEVLNEARREGVRALLQVSDLRAGKVTASTIGFGLGPRLNAAGRLDDAMQSYQLLVTSDPAEANRLARRLDEHNLKRRLLTEQAYERVEQMALADDQTPPLLYAADTTLIPGIVGLVAGKLTEAYYRPSVIVEQNDPVCKGSCRSIAEFHITDALDECRDLLERHGGHAAAAGFTVRSNNLQALRQKLLGIARRELADRELLPTLNIDAEALLEDMNWATIEWLGKLEPCGYGNPVPLFLSRDVSVLRAKAVGNDGKHLRLTVGDGRESRDAIAFRMGDRLQDLGKRVDIVYTLEVNEWNGEKQLQLNVQDIQPSNESHGNAL